MIRPTADESATIREIADAIVEFRRIASITKTKQIRDIYTNKAARWEILLDAYISTINWKEGEPHGRSSQTTN